MAIHIYCTKCYSSNGLEAKACSNCGATFGRDKRYRVCVSIKGKRVTRVVDNLTIARETEAAIKGDMIRGEFEINRNGKKKAPTLGEIWAKYLPWAKEHKKSWIDDLRYYRRHLEPRFGKKAMDTISPIDIERMKTELSKGVNRRGVPFAPQTIKHQLVIIRRLYNLAAKWGMYTGANPVKSVTLPKVDNQVTEFLSDEQLARLLDTLENWPFKDTVAFIKFAMFTGLRRGELFKLRWEDVDLDRALVAIRDPKGGVSVTLPICQQAVDVLKDLPRPSDYVFHGHGGRMRTNFNGPWRRIREAAGLPKSFRFHGLRHHFASTLVSNGIDLLVVKELLTHKDSKTTQRYAHLAPGAIRQGAEKAGELLTVNKAEVIPLVKKE
jgi:integrase